MQTDSPDNGAQSSSAAAGWSGLAETAAGNTVIAAGPEKGCGKSTVLNTLLQHLHAAGKYAAVMSIGFERGGTRQPRTGMAAGQGEFLLQEGDIAITSLPLLKRARACAEILEQVPGRSNAGKLVICRLHRDCRISLLGPEHLSVMAGAVRLIRDSGWADTVLIDGAGGRITQTAAIPDAVPVLSAVITAQNIGRILPKLRLLSLTAGAEQIAAAEWSIRSNPDGVKNVLWPGPLCESDLEKLSGKLEAIHLEDATKIFISPQKYAVLAGRCHISFDQTIRPLAACISCRGLTDEQERKIKEDLDALHPFINPFSI